MLSLASFLETAPYSFVFAVWGVIKLASLCAGALHLHKDGLGLPWKVFIDISHVIHSSHRVTGHYEP